MTTLTPPELATILAALRHLQDNQACRRCLQTMPDFNNAGTTLLSDEAIDALCQRLPPPPEEPPETPTGVPPEVVPPNNLLTVRTFLGRTAFVILTFNPKPRSGDSKAEAWAYQGPLDFEQANPICFGTADNLQDALHALDYHLGLHRANWQSPCPPRSSGTIGA